MGKIADILPVVAELHGRKILLAGNLDRCWTHHRRASGWTEKYIQAGFGEIRQGTVRLGIGSRYVTACHFPYQGDSHNKDRVTARCWPRTKPTVKVPVAGDRWHSQHPQVA